MTHCDCEQCKQDRELIELVREFMPLFMAIVRAQAMAAQTVSNKWRDGQGETAFRKMHEKQKVELTPA
jgi:hypothetical protein